MEIGDDKPLSHSKASELEQKLPNNGENAFGFGFGENLGALNFKSSY